MDRNFHPEAVEFVKNSMIQNNDRHKDYGVDFKFNTGRAIAYFYDQPYVTNEERYRLVPHLEQYFKPNVFDTWPKPDQGACVANHRDLILAKIKKWTRDFQIGPIIIERLVFIKYVSLVVPYNYAFHFRVKLTNSDME